MEACRVPSKAEVISGNGIRVQCAGSLFCPITSGFSQSGGEDKALEEVIRKKQNKRQ
jgi:hypothetical protein